MGPEVGIPTTLAGEYLGGLLGSFIAGKFGQGTCAVGTALVADSVCHACPSESCGFELLVATVGRARTASLILIIAANVVTW